jgi:hypothetical protein
MDRANIVFLSKKCGFRFLERAPAAIFSISDEVMELKLFARRDHRKATNP